MNLTSNIQDISFYFKSNIPVHILRLDQIHPVVSGNKWFKLKYYVEQAIANKKSIITFGGAYSNHIIATAAACANAGLHAVGIIRGEQPVTLSHTLQQAMAYGLQLFFCDRESYRHKIIPPQLNQQHTERDYIIIPEGGYGPLGMQGAMEILNQADTNNYTHILAAVGTGTTLAGLTAGSLQHQKITGIVVMKNNPQLQQEIENLLPAGETKKFHLNHDYHFGGYAKKTEILLQFMNDFYVATSIPSDFVYTGKAFFAVQDLLSKKYFASSDKILVVHTGGLQGNLSLPKGKLIFG